VPVSKVGREGGVDKGRVGGWGERGKDKVKECTMIVALWDEVGGVNTECSGCGCYFVVPVCQVTVTKCSAR
jgi:hypothetical protein